MAKSGPGKHFRKGLSLIQVMRMFPDDATAEKWIAHCRWGADPRLPALRERERTDGREASEPALPLP